MNKINQILISIGILAIGFLIGFVFPHKQDIVISERIDTLIRYDTIRDTVLIPKIITQKETIVDTLMIHGRTDTVFVAVNIPIESKIYQTDEYKAEISGYKSSLDFMEVYQKTVFIDKIQTIKQQDKRRFGIGIHAGYGYSIGPNKFYPTISVGINYSLFEF